MAPPVVEAPAPWRPGGGSFARSPVDRSATHWLWTLRFRSRTATHSGDERKRASSHRWSRQMLRSKNEPLQTSRTDWPPYSAGAGGRCAVGGGVVPGTTWPALTLAFGTPAVDGSVGRVVPVPLFAAHGGSSPARGGTGLPGGRSVARSRRRHRASGHGRPSVLAPWCRQEWRRRRWQASAATWPRRWQRSTLEQDQASR